MRMLLTLEQGREIIKKRRNGKMNKATIVYLNKKDMLEHNLKLMREQEGKVAPIFCGGGGWKK